MQYDALLFRNTNISPEQQYALTKAFDPLAESYGHGNNKTQCTRKSILHPDLKTIPRVPQVQLIGNGTVYNHEGLDVASLKHPSHATFHKTVLSPEDQRAGLTRFYRWHIDAALYDFSPPKVTTLYAIHVPEGPPQICRYDDGTGDELPVPLGTTAFVSGKNMFDNLPRRLQSLAVRTRVRYAPHPYEWMSPASAHSTGLAIENEGKELALDDLPPGLRTRSKFYLWYTWKNPVTGALHFQRIADDVLYPDGAHLTDLKQVRDLLYQMQRPAISRAYWVYPHDWKEKDLVLFHNRGLFHSVVGTFQPDQVRAFHQCNLAASEDPVGPTPEDVKRYA
ncbi:taurine catabolism dioxygenase [Lactifluus volemus]|nr:taurine catabolism dioxygenase [Lactifluus volemus]